jgi:hypothetical protein
VGEGEGIGLASLNALPRIAPHVMAYPAYWHRWFHSI